LDTGLCQIGLAVVSSPFFSVLGGGEVTEAGLVALAVVEHLDELEQVGVGLGPGLEEDAASDPGDLDFEPGPERFHGGVIECVAGRPERQGHVGVTGSEGKVE
jgi:hypothetical protein